MPLSKQKEVILVLFVSGCVKTLRFHIDTTVHVQHVDVSD